jgi:hypothetical protein
LAQDYYLKAFLGIGKDPSNLFNGNNDPASAGNIGTGTNYGIAAGRTIFQNLSGEMDFTYFISKVGYDLTADDGLSSSSVNSTSQTLRYIPSLSYSFLNDQSITPYIKAGFVLGIYGQASNTILLINNNHIVPPNAYIATKRSGGMGKGFIIEAGCDLLLGNNFSFTFSPYYLAEWKNYKTVEYTSSTVNGVPTILYQNPLYPQQINAYNLFHTIGIDLGMKYSFGKKKITP